MAVLFSLQLLILSLISFVFANGFELNDPRKVVRAETTFYNGTTAVSNTRSTITTTLTTSSTLVNTAGCSASCSVNEPGGSSLVWVPITITARVTAASVIIIINGDKTRTSTKYLELPSGVTSKNFETNSDGTATFTVEYPRGPSSTYTTVLSFPTQYTDYQYGFYWDGVLPTTLDNGESVCATNGIAGTITLGDGKYSALFPSHPDWPQPSTFTYPHPVESILSASSLHVLTSIDSYGTLFTPMWESFIGIPSTVCADCSNGAAFSLCTVKAALPAVAVNGADLLTVTSTSYEADRKRPPKTRKRPKPVRPGRLGVAAADPTPLSTVASQPDSSHPTALPATRPSTRQKVQTPGTNATPSRSRATASPSPQPTLVVGSQTVTANDHTEFVISSQTLVLGSSITLGSGSATTIVALTTNSAGHSIVQVGSVIQTLEVLGTPAPTVVIDSNTITANSRTEFVISGQTLAPGSSIILGSGSQTTVVALTTDSESHTILAIGSITSTLGTATPTPLVIDGSTITANSESEFVISGQTLVPGSSITLGSGSRTTVVALTTDSAHHTVIVVGSKTSTLTGEESTAAEPTAAASATTSRTQATATASATDTSSSTPTGNVGDYIASGLGGTANPTGSGAAPGILLTSSFGWWFSVLLGLWNFLG